MTPVAMMPFFLKFVMEEENSTLLFATLMCLGIYGYENNAGCSCGCGVPCPEDWLRWNCSENPAGDTGYACPGSSEPTLLFGSSAYSGTSLYADPGRQAPCTMQNRDVEWVLRICTFLIPGVCMLLSIIPILLVPITREIHAEILEQIKRRHEGKQVVDPLTGLPIRPRKDELDERYLVESFTKGELRAGDRKGRKGLIQRIYGQSTIVAAAVIAILATIILMPTNDVVTLASLALAFFFMIVPWQIAKMRLMRGIDTPEFDNTIELYRAQRAQRIADEEAVDQGTLTWGRDDAASAGDGDGDVQSTSGKDEEKGKLKKVRTRNDVKRELKPILEKINAYKALGTDTLSEEDQRQYKILKIEARKLKDELDLGSAQSLASP